MKNNSETDEYYNEDEPKFCNLAFVVYGFDFVI